MKTVVTGAAGFIGSHLSEALVARGDSVVGIDSFTTNYEQHRKRSNLTSLLAGPRFELVEADIRDTDLDEVLAGTDVVYHLAGKPGVRTSFGPGFADYCSDNILGTQRILEAARAVGVARVVFASSSSIYGNALRYPTLEDDAPMPYSPYGVTKYAAEQLCRVYDANWTLPTVILRYFTVYGPRQRPDMAIQRLVTAALGGQAFPLQGTGTAARAFTYVGDVVRATMAAGVADAAPGTTLNVSGGSSVTMLELIALVEQLTGCHVAIDSLPDQAGDVARTAGDIGRAERLLGWVPEVSLRSGLEAQIGAVRGA